MNFTKNNLYILAAILLVFITGCNEEKDTFDNKVFNSSQNRVSTVLLKGNESTLTKTMNASLAIPEQKDIHISYDVNKELVDRFNQAFYEEASLLPENNYNIPNKNVVISAGTTISTDLIINFLNLETLDRDLIYVLPISIQSVDFDILKSAQTNYFVFKGAALINVVADVEENFFSIDWKNQEPLNNLSQLTLEGLVKARNFDRLISTMMGIEGQFLIRIGDAGFPSNQIQIATQYGNVPEADSNKGLPISEWVHVAVTVDTNSSEINIYINGKLQSKVQKSLSPVNLASEKFYIGKSYDNTRFFAGEFSEFRIWNTIRSQKEIADNFYSIEADSEGLVAYWKFDDGGGSRIKDHTENGNDAIADKDVKWTPVSLPEKNN